MARVLVGIPTRNRPEYVQEAILSVLAQSWQDFRVLVSDNASEPRVSTSVEAFIHGLADPRVSYYRQPVNVKEYGQGRYLFEQCHEEFFTILHDDDRMQPGLLGFAIDVLARDGELAFASTSQSLIDASGRPSPEKTLWYTTQQGRDQFSEGRIDSILEPLLEFGLFSISGTVFRAAELSLGGLVDPDLGGSYPFEFNVFLRVAERRRPAYYSPRPLVAYRWHDKSIRSLESPFFHKEMTLNLIQLLERRRFSAAAERKRRSLLSYNCRNYAIVSWLDGDSGGAYGWLRRAVQLNPWSLRIWAYVALVGLFPFLIPPIFRSKVVLASSR